MPSHGPQGAFKKPKVKRPPVRVTPVDTAAALPTQYPVRLNLPPKPPRPNRGAAWPVLTKELIEDFRQIIPTVLYVETAMRYLGVSRDSWSVWTTRARHLERFHRDHPDADRSGLTPHDLLCVDFLNAFRQGVAEGQLDDLRLIKAHAEKDWRAAAYRLACRDPEKWSEKKSYRVTDNQGNPVQGGVNIYLPKNGRDPTPVPSQPERSVYLGHANDAPPPEAPGPVQSPLPEPLPPTGGGAVPPQVAEDPSGIVAWSARVLAATSPGPSPSQPR
jgi:hypothetical protein